MNAAMNGAMRKTVTGCLVIGLGVFLAAGLFACDRSPDKGEKPAADAAKAAGYICPMHPDYRSDEPGNCPACGMKLVPVPGEETAPPAMEEHDHATPPEEKDPIGGAHDHTSGSGGKTPADVPEGGAMAPGAVTVSPAMQRFIGVKTVTAEQRPLARTIRTVGKVEYDERRVYHVHTKIEGWIEDLYVNVTGEPVRKGQPLFSMYSPSLLATQEEYLIAMRGRDLLRDATTPEARRSGRVMADAARRRLQLWDVGAGEIRRLEQGGKPTDRLTFHSHYDGVVIDKKAVEGLHVTPGADLMTIADLSVVWIQADVYEYELPYVKEGQSARISLSYLPEKTFEGKVVYVYPYLEEATRTGRVRIELENPDGVLKPMMFADVFLESDLGEALVLPESAIMDSGMRKMVYVDRGEGRFEPREVKIGRNADGYLEVLDGVSAGERVAAAANFMIDAESKLREAQGDMSGHQHGAPEESR